MKSFQSPCASTHDAPMKQRLGPAEPSAPPTEHQMVPDSSHDLLRRPDTENLGGGGRMITFCLWQIRSNPLRRHFGVARLARRCIRRRRSALHHLRKKVPRRRALLRRVEVRTTKVRFRLKLLRYKSKTSLKRTTLFLLTDRWRAAPFEDLIRPRGFPAPGPLTWMLSPALKLRLPGRQRWPFSFP